MHINFKEESLNSSICYKLSWLNQKYVTNMWLTHIQQKLNKKWHTASVKMQKQYLSKLSLIDLRLMSRSGNGRIVSWSYSWHSRGSSTCCWRFGTGRWSSWGSAGRQRTTGRSFFIWASRALSLLGQTLLDNRLSSQYVAEDGQHRFSHPASIHL